MSWTDKFQITNAAIRRNRRLECVFDTTDPAPEDFVSSLLAKYPFLSENYVNFLRYTDGAQIWMYVLAGSGASTFPSIIDLIERWKPNLGDGLVLPIGEDPSGACLALTHDGRIVLFDYRMDDPCDARMVAPSFDDFLDNVLMGKGYPTLFPNGLSAAHENEWTRYLREQKWL